MQLSCYRSLNPLQTAEVPIALFRIRLRRRIPCRGTRCAKTPQHAP